MTQITPEDCKKYARCHNFRECEPCAKIRQNQFEKAAEEHVPTWARITFAVIHFEDAGQLNKSRKEISDWMVRNTHGHTWSIEVGNTAFGLHLNIIMAGEREITKGQIARLVPDGSDIWSQKIPREQTGKMLNYIVKPKGIPTKAQYDGRLYGRAGCMRNPVTILTQTNSGAATLYAINQKMQNAGMQIDKDPHEDPMYANAPAVSNFIRAKYIGTSPRLDKYGLIDKNPRKKETDTHET